MKQEPFKKDGTCRKHGQRMCPSCANLKFQQKFSKKKRSEWAKRGGRPRKAVS